MIVSCPVRNLVFALSALLFLLWQLLAAYWPILQLEQGVGRIPSIPGIGSAALHHQSGIAYASVGNADETDRALRESLIRQPYNQAAVNVLSVPAFGQEGKRQEVLATLGWRDTESQIALIQDAGQRGDYRGMTERADALLRRNRRADDMFDLLFALESVGEARPLLAERLAKSPNWRKGFFVRSRLAEPDRVTNRAGMLRFMFIQKLPVDRIEVANAVYALMKHNQTLAAYDLWRTYRGLPTSNTPIFDSNFADLKDGIEVENYISMPFEWILGKSTGVEINLGNDAYGTALDIEWDGRGGPLFAKQTVRLRPGDFQLVLHGKKISPDDVNRLNVSLTCEENQNVLHFRFSYTNGGYRSAPISLHTLKCAFARLEISGAPQNFDRRLSISFSSIALVQS